MFRLFECCALSFFERFVLSFSLKIERFVSDSAEIWICGLYKKAGSNNYLCTFRVGEIYLTAAEAAARLGELSQARTRLLELMRKRYAPEAYEAKSVVVNAMDKEALVQEILDERARELAFEGHRWFDLRRSTRPRLEKVLDGTRYVLEENDARYTLAIPKEAIEANPGLLN